MLQIVATYRLSGRRGTQVSEYHRLFGVASLYDKGSDYEESGSICRTTTLVVAVVRH